MSEIKLIFLQHFEKKFWENDIFSIETIIEVKLTILTL